MNEGWRHARYAAILNPNGKNLNARIADPALIVHARRRANAAIIAGAGMQL